MVHKLGRPFTVKKESGGIEAEFKILNVGDTPLRIIIDLKASPPLQIGELETLLLDIVTKVGTKPASVDVEILDTDDISADLDSVNTIYRNTAIPIISATGKESLINQVNINRKFVLKGNAGKIQLVLTLNVAAGDTNYEFVAQIYGGQYG